MKLYLTYDYELPLGGVRSFDKGLFGPSEKILETANQLKAPLVLFADICSAIQFKEWDYEGYYLPFKKQMQDALLAGHDVQLHIHPHWMTSEYNGETFIPSNMNMLSHFKDSEAPNNIEGIVKAGIDELTAICREVKPDYKCIAYRAGSFNLAPETKRILTALYDNGIRIDSSIPKNYYLRTDIVTIDHRSMPKAPNWIIDTEGPINKAAKKGLYEVTVAGKSKNFITNLPARFKKKKHTDRIYDHTGKGHIGQQQSFMDIVKLSFSPRMLGFDNYFQETEDLVNILKHNINKYKAYEDVHLSLISHPKAMGDYHISMMHDFIATVQRDFEGVAEFSTFAELYEHLKKTKKIEA